MSSVPSSVASLSGRATASKPAKVATSTCGSWTAGVSASAPSSRLQIENYSHSATQPQGSAIKFRLDEGVIRSITGTWGEEARERFRLNTPMAAIGIKGTDFVVKSDANATAASVYSGAILLAPLDDCATPLGSCQKGREKLLSADMKGLMLELNRQQGAPQFVAAVDLLASARRPAAGVAIATTVPPVVGVGVGAEARAATGANLDRPIVNEARSRDLVEAATQIAAAQIAAAHASTRSSRRQLQRSRRSTN
jgi:hypothetical protein